MRAIIMGCGRVGILLTQELVKGGHDIVVIDKNERAFDRLPPGFEARTLVGLGFDRDVLEEAGIKEADAFLAVSSGDNSNILSARVAREHYHVPKVIARIYDPMRAEIYERLNIPTVSTTRWGVKQMILMLSHTRDEIKESLAGGDLLRMRVQIPAHLVGTRVTDLNVDGRVLVAGVDRGGTGFIPESTSTFQEGDFAALVVQKDAVETIDELLQVSEDH
ncbi:MAG TPA: TrkA family potassium uptake protein [Actinomycetota bacterium]|nr:TrkA family potassium uptake protein [Actinomycetota bacterium]